MNESAATRIAPNPSDSMLLTLARAAMAQDASIDAATFPHLDLNDPKQREFGDYELLEEIGRGGMGVVYRARQKSLDRDVAIKFIANALADGINVARFLSEARAAARLLHPNIVAVHEVGSIDGVHYFSMPLVKGRTLADLLEGGALSASEAVALLRKLCDALNYAHRLGLLHLDLKPANVLIDERGEPLVSDFGLARHMDEHGEVHTQEVSGTPAFMAPEQILIKQYRLTPATDIYALGAILYRALTGVSPHGEGNPDELMRRAAANRIPAPRTLARRLALDLSAICMKCLELQPIDRYPSVAALDEDLRRFQANEPVTARPLNVFQRLSRWTNRNPWQTSAYVATLTLMVVAWGFFRESEQARVNIEAQRNAAETARGEAEAQRDHAIVTSQLGAWLYAQTASGIQNDQDIGTRLLQWLRTTLPGDEARQTGVLTAFLIALKNENHEAIGPLFVPLIEVMGAQYRRSVIAALIAGQESNRYALAARLAWFDERNAAESQQLSTLLEKAITAQPNDIGVWSIAATFCTGPEGAVRCLHPEAAEHLRHLDPDNAYPWLLQVQSGDAGSVAALRAAAQRMRFDDYFRATWTGYIEALHKGGVPIPKLISGPMNIMEVPESQMLGAIAIGEATSFPIANWQALFALCDPAKQQLDSPQGYHDCRTVGEMMARSKATLVTRHIGAQIVQRVAKGTPLAQEMFEMRRHYFHVMEARSKLTYAQETGYPEDTFITDISREGELEAIINRLEHYGIPTQPPANWQPKDLCVLELPEDRDACRKASAKPEAP